MDDVNETLNQLRSLGWTVAIHNDYRQNGEAFTFWVFTHPGTQRFIKGEGRTDKEALEKCKQERERFLFEDGSHE